MKAIITVLGTDKVGIIAKVCSFLADREINILDISQTIVQGFSNMMMIVDMDNSTDSFENVYKGLEDLGKNIGVEIKLQREDIFDSMHRI